MKLIFVTGGVVSGLGKGITASSIGRLMKSSGYSVNIIKMDPYLQIDAGTMSPYEHGEVFVTNDGAETDLDLGHYERFIDTNLTGDSSITSGKIYSSVIQKERRGDYLGKTVQVIPHITDEVKSKVKSTAKDYDITIVEIGGTIGDIEAPHFIESIRQLKKDIGHENVLYVHVAPILYMQTSGEIKTKPIQHSVKELRQSGIQADILICRTSVKIPSEMKEKISNLCDVDLECVIEAIDAKSIYEVPFLYKDQNLDKIVQKKLNLEYKESDLSDWSQNVNNLLNPKKEITIGIIGKYTQFKDAYLSLMEAISHAGANNNSKVKLNWIESDLLENKNYNEYLLNLNKSGQLDGIIIPGGFGSRGVEGKINGVRFARENNIPFLGICLGLQVAVIEFARNVCNITDANSTEFEIICKDPVIDIMEEQKNIAEKGGTMRLGEYEAILKEGSLAYNLYGQEVVFERHRHRYEVNFKYHEILEKNGLLISGLSPNNTLAEFVEIPTHKYFIATQAHPEFKSRINNVHPLFDGLVKACLN